MDAMRSRSKLLITDTGVRRLPDWPIEFKLFATAALTFIGVAVLMGATYVVFAHQGANDSYWVGPQEIAALYTGPGVNITTLISLAHIHLLGLFGIFTVVGFVFLHSTLSVRARAFWSTLPFAAFIIDVACWFLTKEVGFDFVWGVILGGFVFILALGLMIIVSLFQLWLLPPTPAATE
jgi:hypothetical protein